MEYNVKSVGKKKIAGFHLVGPWEQTVKQGFEQLMIARARVENYDFATPWYQFFESLMQSKTHQMAMKPCFEVYLNDGNQDGYWDIDMYIAVEPVVK